MNGNEDDQNKPSDIPSPLTGGGAPSIPESLPSDKPKFSSCPGMCKVGKLKVGTVDEIDVALGQGRPYQDIVDEFMNAHLSVVNLSTHKRKHLDMAKVLQELKDHPRSDEGESAEDELKRIQKSDPTLANKIKELESMPVRNYKSIDIVTVRIKQIVDVLKELESVKPTIHRLIISYDQVLQKYLELNGRLTGEFGRTEEATQDLSQAVAFITKEIKGKNLNVNV